MSSFEPKSDWQVAAMTAKQRAAYKKKYARYIDAEERAYVREQKRDAAIKAARTYQVVQSTPGYPILSFENEVTSLRKAGWSIVGGVRVVTDFKSGTRTYFQTLVKAPTAADAKETRGKKERIV